MPAIPPTLAEVPTTTILWLSLLLVAFIMAGWVTVWQVKRRLQRANEGGPVGFTLSDLRQLHKSGQMTDAEFERAKAKVVDAARRASERDAARAAESPGKRRGGEEGSLGGPKP